MFASAKGKRKSKFDSYSVRNSVLIISPYYVPFGIVACTLFPTILEIAVMNSQGNRVEKNTHAQRVQMRRILRTSEA